MRVQQYIKKVVSVAAIMALAGCGGGGGGAATEPAVTRMGGAVQGPALTLAGNVSTLAGSASSTDGTGTSARFNLPSDVASDGANLYVVDTGNSTIRKISIATGATSTLAGSAGITGSSDGVGAAARFNFPYGITISSDKTRLFVCDTGNDTIRSIAIASGAVGTVAGAAGVIGSADGEGGQARFNAPTGITTDGVNLYVTDTLNDSIRKIELSSGEVSTLAGGSQGFADGTGAAARFRSPYGITTDGSNLYVTDNGNSAIRRILAATGAVSTLVQPEAGFVAPAGITTDGTSLYVSDAGNNVIGKVVIATQAVSVIAGDAIGGAPGAIDAVGGAARFNTPSGMITDGSNLYTADAGNGTIRKTVIATGAVSTVAGTPVSANGAGTEAGFNALYEIATDGLNLYLADSGNNTIRKIVIATGTVSTLAGRAGVSGAADGVGAAATFNAPTGLTTDGSSVFVADTGNNTIRQINIASGAVSTLAGTAGVEGSADGTGAAATFSSPGGITTDGVNLYLSDSGNGSIRKIALGSAQVTTLNSGADLELPYGITTDGTSLYVVDAGNNSIRRISLTTGAVSTLHATGVVLDFPTAVTTDGKFLYVADSGSGAIRRIDPGNGAASTVATGLSDPSGVTTDGKSLYLTDAQDNIVLRIR